MQITFGVLLAPIFMILMAPTMATAWLIISLAWVTKDYKKPEKPDFKLKGPKTNIGFC